MEALVARALTPYELTYGKPQPNFTQAAIQANLISELRARCAARYRVVAAVSLTTELGGNASDLAIYPTAPLDYTSRVRPPHPPAGYISIPSWQPLDEVVKRTRTFFALGVRSCWIVQPAVQGILVFEDPKHYNFFHADDTLRDAVLGLEIPLAPVFA